MYASNRESLKNEATEDVTLNQLEDEYREVVDVFPSLRKYKKDHNEMNLKKLCNEIVEFCFAVYASTKNDSERSVYYSMVEKLRK